MVTILSSPNHDPDNGIRANGSAGSVMASTAAAPLNFNRPTANFTGDDSPLCFQHDIDDARRGLAELEGDPIQRRPPDLDPPWRDPAAAAIIHFDWCVDGDLTTSVLRQDTTPAESTPRLGLPNFDGKDVHGWLYTAKQLVDSCNISSDLQVRMAALYLDEAPLSWYRGNVRAKGKPLSWVEFEKGLLSLYETSRVRKVFEEIPQPLPLLVRKLLDTTPQFLSLAPITDVNSQSPTNSVAELITSEEEMVEPLDKVSGFPTRKSGTRPPSNAFAQTVRLNSELANINTEGSTTAVASDFLHMPLPLLPPLLVSPTSSLLPSHFDSDNALPFILSFVGHQTETEEQFGESSYMALAELIVSKEDERSNTRKVFDRMSEKNLISGSTLTSARVLWGPVTPPPKYAPYSSPSMHYSKCLSHRWARKGRYIWVSFPAYLLDHGPEISGVGVLPRGEFPPLSAFHKKPGSGDALLAKLASLGWNAYKVLWTPSLKTSVHFEKWMLIQLTLRVLEARLFGRMMILDVILWKVMICWYTKNGYVRETEELFKERVAWTASELTEDHSKCQNVCLQNMVMRLLRSYMAFETVAGILKGYDGLSAAVYTEIYTGVLHNSSTGLLLFLSLGLLAICFVTMFFVRPCTPASEEDSSDHGHLLFTQIPSALLGLYLLIATIVKDVISVNDAISYALFGIMILLLLAPLAIPVKMSLYPTKPKRTDAIESSSSHEQLPEFDEDKTEPLLAVSLETNLVSLQEIEDDNDVDILLAQGEGAVIPGKKKRRPGRREDFNFKQALVKAESWLLFLVNFIGVGTGVSVLVPTVSELFGLMHFGRIYNFMALGNTIRALLFSALLAGYMYDQEAARQHTGNSCHGPDCFRLTFFVLFGLSVIGSALGVVLTLRVKPVYQMLYSRVLFGCLKVHCILCPHWAHTSIWCCFH